MEKNTPKYWKGLDELNSEPSFVRAKQNEFAEKLPMGDVLNDDTLGLTTGRRDFLKLMGFSISAATLAACSKTPIKKIVPYVFKPVDYEPGIANYYATTCMGCQANCSLIVKTKEGRPIKVEGTDNSPINKGGACAVGQATILSLYDSGRLAAPQSARKATTWTKLDQEVQVKLNNISTSGGKIVLLTGSVNGPTSLKAINEFKAKYTSAQHIMYDAVSFSALIDAHKQVFGIDAIPGYQFSEAGAVVSVGADFLGTWLSPVEFTKDYTNARKVDEGQTTMLTHFQFESNLSLTGSNADYRAVVAPSQYGEVLISLHDKVAKLLGKPAVGNSTLELMGNSIGLAAKKLVENGGKGIVITSSNDINHQLLVVSINEMLGNYGKTLNLQNVSLQRRGNDAQVINLVKELMTGKVAAILIGADVNPVYTLAEGKNLADAISKAGLSVSFSEKLDETALACQYVAPTHNALESWGDAEPRRGFVSFIQPTITPIFNTRQWQESLLHWTGNNVNYHDYLQANTVTTLGLSNDMSSGNMRSWESLLEKGFVKTSSWIPNYFDKKIDGSNIVTTVISSISSIASAGNYAAMAGGKVKTKAAGSLEIILHEEVAIRDGQNSNNPWLQELPDPISKVSWDAVALVSPKWAAEQDLSNEDVIDITVNGKTISAPIILQPGQRDKTIALAFGYGRKLEEKAGKVANKVAGYNAYSLVNVEGGYFNYSLTGVTAKSAGKTYDLAFTQTHHNIEGRDLVRETTLAEMAMGNYGQPEEAEAGGAHVMSMYRDWRFPGHHWGMAVDLNACTGCNACVVSCSAENNVPVVGKDEVRLRREMHWMRIDRYFSVGDTKGEMHNKYKEIDQMEDDKTINYENVKVVYQPLMCQHCENAPCENVCPVNAINHSSEGLNQQVYNRCVGTKYCANNCPYKVRRFNWFAYYNNDKFDYHLNDELGKMVLNPDVTTRMRGVMEKCTFCVQRIQMGKLEAKKGNRTLKDGEVRTACQQTCPANAIVFGDMNDKKSEIYKLVNNKRNYSILTELNTRPGVHYLSKVRATEPIA